MIFALSVVCTPGGLCQLTVCNLLFKQAILARMKGTDFEGKEKLLEKLIESGRAVGLHVCTEASFFRCRLYSISLEIL